MGGWCSVRHLGVSPVKKSVPKKTAAARKVTARKKAVKKKAVAKKVTARKAAKTTSKKVAPKRTVARKKAAPRKAASRRRTPRASGPAKPLADLNTAVPRGLRSAASKEMWAQRSITGTSQCNVVTAHTGDVTAALLAFIAGSPSIVGCVAWLSSAQITEALGQVSDVTILVQKERDLRGETNLGRALVHRYSAMGDGVVL